MGLVTAVPLTRLGLEPRRVARHVEASSWPALLVVAATAGIFAVAGGEIAARVLGSAYGDDVGAQIGAPRRRDGAVHGRLGRAVGHVPARVRRRARRAASPVGAAVLAIHVPFAFAGQALAGLDGLALALAVSTAVAFGWMLTFLHAARSTIRRLALGDRVVAGCAIAGFVPAGALLGPAGAVVVGLVLSTAVLALVRPVGLRSAWHYLRELA